MFTVTQIESMFSLAETVYAPNNPSMRQAFNVGNLTVAMTTGEMDKGVDTGRVDVVDAFIETAPLNKAAKVFLETLKETLLATERPYTFIDSVPNGFFVITFAGFTFHVDVNEDMSMHIAENIFETCVNSEDATISFTDHDDETILITVKDVTEVAAELFPVTQIGDFESALVDAIVFHLEDAYGEGIKASAYVNDECRVYIANSYIVFKTNK